MVKYYRGRLHDQYLKLEGLHDDEYEYANICEFIDYFDQQLTYWQNI